MGYVSSKAIANRLSRNMKGTNFDIFDVAEWCGECEIEEIGSYDSFRKVRNHKMDVKNNKGAMPCDVYRILSILKEGNKCDVTKYTFDGVYVRFDLDSQDQRKDEYTVEVDYMAIVTDEEGLPMIREGHEEACYWYCLTKILFQDWLDQKIASDRWAYINDRVAAYVIKAKQSFRNVSREDMNEISYILHNMIPRVRMSRDID